MSVKKERKSAHKKVHWLAYILLLIGVVMFLYPFLWMVSASLRSLEEVAVSGMSIWPDNWRWDNYAKALTAFPFGRYLVNTVITTVFPIVGTVLSSSIVGYAFARLKVRGSGILFVLVLSTMLLPGEVTMIPQFILFKNLGMLDTLYPLIVPAFFGSAFYIFLLRQFYSRLPVALEEAAIIDGCGYFKIWWKIFLPLSKPALMAVGVMVFMGSWNNFMGPLIYINSDKWKTLTLGLAGFQGTYATDTNLLMAAAVVITLPCILLFFTAQKAFMEGLTFSGSKES
ncbi:carbohydrate ABC transporter permease [Paenibacillus taichungensis]|uniref:carbohydrate ABC transporter permease n=1 Tax=Paenibacillus taichungensis TaxID=484184 RepID=UPI002DB6C2A3|nr:carbohydrate ABC transporter permease [Paenibacillus taichungensis]MEC0105857.1 carbohydrate ABC transporter permease [Paenibacillus taichungensis]MEC0196545.1 carbohydrate ABC transporter permease [Paenibacillus taichungensis]